MKTTKFDGFTNNFPIKVIKIASTWRYTISGQSQILHWGERTKSCRKPIGKP